MTRIIRRGVLYVVTDDQLKSKRYYALLWKIARRIGIPRRKLKDAISFLFLYCSVNRIEIRCPDNSLYVPGLIDDYLPDPDCRWLTTYFRSDETGMRPKHKSKKYELLRIIDIFLKGQYPKLTRLLKSSPI